MISRNLGVLHARQNHLHIICVICCLWSTHKKLNYFYSTPKLKARGILKNANSNRCIGSIKAKFAEFIIKHNSIGWVYISIYLSKEWNCFLINLIRNIIWFYFQTMVKKKVIFNIITGIIVNREMTDALISAEFRVFFV